MIKLTSITPMGMFHQTETSKPNIQEAETDHEVSMAQNSLDQVIRDATELKQKIGNVEKEIPAWIQDHITNGENYIHQANKNYHEYNEKDEE